MGLYPLKTQPALKYGAIDLFLLQMHADEISSVLDSWVTFAERILPHIRRNKDLENWNLNRELIIHRRHWLMLSKRVMDVARMLGSHYRDNHSKWPGHDNSSTASGTRIR